MLRNSKGSDVKVWGSSKLVKLLLMHDLVDELWLKIHPLILGKGKNLFDTGAVPVAFKLTVGCITPGGVIIVSYKQAGKVKTGTVES